MRIFVVMLFLSGALNAPVAHAQGDEVENSAFQSVSRHPSRTRSENRSDKTVSLTVTPIGLGPAGDLVRGLSLGYFVNKNTIISLEQMNGSMFLTGDTTDHVELNSYGAFVKQFIPIIGESFYVKGGATWNHITNFRNHSHSSSTAKLTQFDATTVDAVASLGNEWQARNFTLGCDWIRYAYTIQKNVSVDDGGFDHPLGDTNIALLYFYLGFSF